MTWDLMLGTVPNTTMTYIRGWMQMVYRHMIYSPETDKQVWQWDHDKWRLNCIDNIYMHCQDTLVQYIKDINNPHSVHNGSSLSRLALLPLFFMLHEAVVSSSAGGLLLIMLPALGLTPFPSCCRHHPTSLSDTGTLSQMLYDWCQMLAFYVSGN
jgi:hypothetical protein